MMRSKSFILIILICGLFVCGCGNNEDPAQVSFYYRNSRIEYSSENGAIGSEICKEPIDHLAYEKLLNTYLNGPQSQTLETPFPHGTVLVSFAVEQQNAYVILSNAFAELTGVDLSVACACLSLTVKEMTGCATVTISAQDTLLDNRQSITVDTNTLQLIDQVHP